MVCSARGGMLFGVIWEGVRISSLYLFVADVFYIYCRRVVG